MNRFVNKVCPYCKTQFKEDDEVVVCSQCEMPHHKECWMENKGCTTFGCMGTIDVPKSNISSDEVEELSLVKYSKFCPKCGTPNENNKPFCAKCGSNLEKTDTDSAAPRFTPSQDNQALTYQQPQTYQQQMYQQPQTYQQQTYQQPQIYAQMNGLGGLDPDLVMMIGDKNKEYYVEKFSKIKSTGKTSAWNWPAFLFTPIWLLYRKMYAYGAGILGGLILLNFILPALMVIAEIACSVIFGIIGNNLYLQELEKKVAQVKFLQEPLRSQFILKNKGENLLWAIVPTVIYLIALAI